MSMEESISLEETNKIRISLGLKPLTDDSAPVDSKEQQAEDNYTKEREKDAQAKETKRIQDRIAKVRNKRDLNAKLKGTTLGDADPDVDDTLKWLKKNKKREKELAKKRQEEIESMDLGFQGDSYTEKDLEGLKVSHDFAGMEDGEAHILTLKDSRILDDEEDELQNVEITEEERRKKNQELKIKRKDYTGYDDEEFSAGQPGMKRDVLAKYNDVIDGDKEMGFRLGSSTSTSKKSVADQQSTTMAVNKSLLSVDYAKNQEISDYMKEGDVGFKKPKKKKRSNRRVAEADPESAQNGEDQMQVDEKIEITRNLDVNFVDDEDLQSALARSRKANLRKLKKLSPEELAKRIAEQRQQSEDAIKVEEADGAEVDANGLTFDDTSEFVRSITYDPNAVKKEPVEPRVATKQPSEAPDVPMDEADEAVHELEAGEVLVKEEEYDDEMLDAIEDAIRTTEAEEKARQEGVDELGTSGEKTHSSGLASTLDILRHQGILAVPTADSVDREKTQLQRDLWLADQRRRVAQRDMEKQKGRGGNKDQAQREYENRLRDQQEARANLDAFKDYKPDVKIVYYDEFGRELTPKEAWKALSHKFHGKGSGRMKTEKRLKKIAEEKKQEGMVSGDTPLSMNQAFQTRQEKAGQAHFVLSVGNRGAVPAAAEFLDAQPLTKAGKTEKARKKKEGKNQQMQQQVVDSTGFITLPAPTAAASAMDSPVPGGSSVSTPSNASPAPRPGFARITSSAVDNSDTRASTPIQNGDNRTKVAFGFAMKRKAGVEHQDSPPPKRR